MRSGVESAAAAAPEVRDRSCVEAVHEHLRGVRLDLETQVAFSGLTFAHISLECRRRGVRLADVAEWIGDVSTAIAISAVEEPLRPAISRCVGSRACLEDVAIERRR